MQKAMKNLKAILPCNENSVKIGFVEFKKANTIPNGLRKFIYFVLRFMFVFAYYYFLPFLVVVYSYFNTMNTTLPV